MTFVHVAVPRQCNNYNDNYNKIPQPNNVWAAVCEVRQEGTERESMFFFADSDLD